jgi:uncharacterized protein (DUF2267 family)
MPADLTTLDPSFATSIAWLDTLAADLGEERPGAYRVLAAVLHALRDSVTVACGAQLAVGLPTVIKGVFFDRWDLTRLPAQDRGPDEFLERVAADAGLHDRAHAAIAVERVARLLRDKLGDPAVDEVLSGVRADVRSMFAS